MGKAVRLDVNGDVSVVDFPEPFTGLQYFYDGIGCDYVEIVRSGRLPRQAVMVIDENGKLKKDPKINICASWLYGTDYHGEPIVGNAYVVSEKFSEFCGLDEVIADCIKDALERRKAVWHENNSQINRD